MDAIATCAVRVGLAHPVFDRSCVEGMPYRRGTTIVADTSGALQGGLDFVTRFLHPAVRIKVPAIVHMEIVNQGDSFLKRRRASKINTSALLFDHLLSQAGQRVLLRLEFREETEVERTLLVGDPLRNAFQRDSEQEWLDLNLSVSLRSYCDRLIIEAARQHQAQATPGHPIQLLTSDQGFARMALAEGITPLYFHAIPARSFFGRRLVGTLFEPFTASLYRVPLEMVLWELATAFGVARLISSSEDRAIEIAAIGEELAWSPVHSQDDLLWLRIREAPPIEAAQGSPDADATAAMPESGGSTAASTRADVVRPASGKRPGRAGGFYRIVPERMLQLVWALARHGRMSEDRVMRLARAESKGAAAEYQRFLVTGGFVEIDAAGWALTDAGVALAQAITAGDVDGIAAGLERVPSFRGFLTELRAAEKGKPATLRLPERAESTYRALGEIVCAGAPIGREGYYSTTERPNLADFAEIALRCFEDLDNGDGFVSVGAWLEALVRVNGIHPEIARRLLQEASASGLIVGSTEGSTTDTRHDHHAVRVLRSRSSGPRVETVHLYRGDFLIPNKSSSSIRLGRPNP
jgi:hypothetical protein